LAAPCCCWSDRRFVKARRGDPVEAGVWEHWLSPGVSTGIAVGALLSAAIHCRGPCRSRPRPSRLVIAHHAARPGFAVRARAALKFAWSYGHLLNFNDLTRTVLLAWPVVASAFLIHARRPAALGPAITRRRPGRNASAIVAYDSAGRR
jgi:hypothetical protein